MNENLLRKVKDKSQQEEKNIIEKAGIAKQATGNPLA